MKVLVVLCLAVACSALPTGLVGPSGTIGPSGMVGPSGPVQFQQPAWAFMGNAAHAHIAALNAVRLPTRVAYQAAPAVPMVYGVNPAGCVVGPSGQVCPTGNIQYLS